MRNQFSMNGVSEAYFREQVAKALKGTRWEFDVDTLGKGNIRYGHRENADGTWSTMCDYDDMYQCSYKDVNGQIHSLVVEFTHTDDAIGNGYFEHSVF